MRTGRLSCSKPNLQQIPKALTIGGISLNPRNFFVSTQDRILVAADYSQIEVRVMAHIANDNRLIAAFSQSEDV